MVRWRALGYWSMGYFAARDTGHQREYIGDNAMDQAVSSAQLCSEGEVGIEAHYRGR
jgi:hypothetical protein